MFIKLILNKPENFISQVKKRRLSRGKCSGRGHRAGRRFTAWLQTEFF